MQYYTRQFPFAVLLHERDFVYTCLVVEIPHFSPDCQISRRPVVGLSISVKGLLITCDTVFVSPLLESSMVRLPIICHPRQGRSVAQLHSCVTSSGDQKITVRIRAEAVRAAARSIEDGKLV